MLLESNDPPAIAEPAPGPAPEIAPHRWRRDLLLLLGYVLLSLLFWRELLPHLGTHALGSGVLDPGRSSGS